MTQRNYWLVKTEPSTYSWSRLVADGKARWDGVRNFEARNNLRAMSVGDLCLFYHSNEGKEIVGIARVASVAYRDPTSDGDWSCVDIEPVTPLTKPVTLAAVRERKSLVKMQMLTHNRLSVSKVTATEMKTLLAMGDTPHP